MKIINFIDDIYRKYLCKKYNKEILSEEEICKIFDNNYKSDWLEIMNKKLIYKEIKNKKAFPYIDILNSNYITYNISLEEISILKFPYNIGDIVTHKIIGGKFVIYNLPSTDIRRLIDENHKISFLINWEAQCYYVDGFLDNGKVAGTWLESNMFAKDGDVEQLTDGECHWKNWIKIGNIFEDKDCDNRFKEIILDYWKDCPNDYQPLYNNIQKIKNEVK